MDTLILLTLIPVVVNAIHYFEYLGDFMRQRQPFMSNKYRPNYHITAPEGWISNPAGFIFYKKQYHIFYQYRINRGPWSRMQLGHVVSKNLVDWSHHPPALTPDEYYDKDGCYAGSTQMVDDHLYLFFTGRVSFNNQTFETQNVALSTDGFMFQKFLYNPIIRGTPNGVEEFRNPKVWRFRRTWYMIVGSATRERNGQLLLYTSPDIYTWTFNATLVESYGDMGYLWESPDIFEIDDVHVLLLSAQGVQVDGHRFKNLYQSGYVLSNFNYLRAQFDDLEISTATFNELDYGHDFYAAKTMIAPDGRVLLVAWLGMWKSDFLEKQRGWAGMLTVVREVRLNKEGQLLMQPVGEISKLRTEILEDAWYRPGEAFLAEAKCFEMIVNSTTVFSDVIIMFKWLGGRYTIKYSPEFGQVSVNRGGEDGFRRAYWLPKHHVHFHILVDSSSIEVFCGEGEVVFSSRIYPKAIRVNIGGNSQLHIIQYRLRRSVGFDKNIFKYFKRQAMKTN